MTEFELERCYVCKKIFCCVDCCVVHINNKHPGRELLCSICRCKPLIVRNFNNEELLCHIVFNHLPLHCRLCGELFKNAEDLKAIGKCNQHPLITIEPPTFFELNKSTLSIHTPSPLIKIPSQSSINRDGMSITGEYNSKFDKFISPPELTRNTSTPMHIGIMKKNIQHKVQKIPNIILTAPSFSIKNNSKLSNSSFITSSSNLSETGSGNYASVLSSIKSNSLDKTPLKSALSVKYTSSEINSQYFDYSKNFSDKKLAAMEELDENEIDMELTNVHGAIYTENTTLPLTKNILTHQETKDSGKKVRFTENSEIKTGCNNIFNVSEVEEFFEARQSLDETSGNTKNSSVKIFKEHNFKDSAHNINNNNSKNVNETTNENSKSIQNEKSKSNSRLVMMVLVEQTGNDNPTDLTPLIDSSLKKLGSVLSKNSLTQNSSMDLDKNKVETAGKFSLVSVDTYSSVSTVECFKVSNAESIPLKSQSNIDLGGTGIFSAVANAVKSAFKNWSGVVTKKKSPESTTPNEFSQHSSTPPSQMSEKSSGIIANSTMNSSNRPGKRSRDDNDSISLDSPEVSDVDSDGSTRQNDIRSPLQKRPCSWYRQIRGREPISRMKNSFISPRGITYERQCFQQGSLTIGDTIMPLPSRANQATQTE